MHRTYTCLWFDHDVEEIAQFYASTFPNTRILDVANHPEGRGEMSGKSMVANIEIDGVRYMLLNGGPYFTLSEAASVVLPCADQAEIDHYWQALTADGGEVSACGWLKDKFGLSWQVIPHNLDELLSGSPKKFEAMMEMSKIVIADLEAA